MNSAPPSGSTGPAGPFDYVSRMLRDIHPDLQLLDFVTAPAGHYTAKVKLGRTRERSIIVTCQLVEQAVAGTPVAVSALKATFRTQLLPPQLGARAGTSSRYRALVQAKVRCAVCEKLIRYEDSIVVRRAKVMHAACDPGPDHAERPR